MRTKNEQKTEIRFIAYFLFCGCPYYDSVTAESKDKAESIARKMAKENEFLTFKYVEYWKKSDREQGD